jgi:hypothetical protein
MAGELMPKLESVLVLHVKGKYFDQIRAGTKTEEYREFKPYWQKRLLGKKYAAIVIMKGYPKFSAMCTDNCLDFKWDPATISIVDIRHEQFGPDPVKVFAIKLVKK